MDPNDLDKYAELHRARMRVAQTILFAFLKRLGCKRPVWHTDVQP